MNRRTSLTVGASLLSLAGAVSAAHAATPHGDSIFALATPFRPTDTRAERTKHLLAMMKKATAASIAETKSFSKPHHPDMVAHIMGSPTPIRGREALASALARMIRAFLDVHVDNDPYAIHFGEGDWITVISKNAGTFSGDLSLPGGKVIHGTGKRFDVNFTTTARWKQDSMVEEWVFWDTALVNQQIGLA